ncbi:unnamed protein product [Brassica rapa subsp. narinosa]
MRSHTLLVDDSPDKAFCNPVSTEHLQSSISTLESFLFYTSIQTVKIFHWVSLFSSYTLCTFKFLQHQEERVNGES